MKENEDIDKTREWTLGLLEIADKILEELEAKRRKGFSAEELFGERERKITDIENKKRWVEYNFNRLVELGGSVSEKGYFNAIDRVSDCSIVAMPEGLHIAENLYVSQNELNPPFVIPNIGIASELVAKLYDYYYEELKKDAEKLYEEVKKAEKELKESWN